MTGLGYRLNNGVVERNQAGTITSLALNSTEAVLLTDSQNRLNLWYKTASSYGVLMDIDLGISSPIATTSETYDATKLQSGAILLGDQPQLNIHNTVTVNWAGTPVPANARVASVNLYQALNNATANSQAYKDVVDYLNPPDVRIHSLEMMRDSTIRALGWVKNPTLANYSWDEPKIVSALSNLAPGRTKILCICRFPEYLMATNGKLLAGKTTEFANFCVQLLTIAQNVGAGITHVNLLNELDSVYNNDFATLGQIWNEVRNAIKLAFPSMLVGGHSFANVYSDTNVNQYLGVCAANLDFFAFNAYSGPNPPTKTMQELWNSAANSMRDSCTHAKNRLTAYGVPNCPVYATEMGMMYLSAAAPLNIGSRRSVWEALRLIKTTSSNAAFVAAWNEADDWHGLCSSPSSGYQKRPAAHVYSRWNSLCKGQVIPSAVTGIAIPVTGTTPATGVSSIAIKQPNNKNTIVLVNRSELDRVVKVVNTDWSLNPIDMVRIDLITSTGMQTSQIPFQNLLNGYSLPIDAVAFISEP
jgi:hypothetical protein